MREGKAELDLFQGLVLFSSLLFFTLGKFISISPYLVRDGFSVSSSLDGNSANCRTGPKGHTGDSEGVHGSRW